MAADCQPSVSRDRAAPIGMARPGLKDGEPAQLSTAGGNDGFRVCKPPAPAMVPPATADLRTAFEVDILGARHPMKVIAESPYDPDNERLRVRGHPHLDC